MKVSFQWPTDMWFACLFNANEDLMQLRSHLVATLACTHQLSLYPCPVSPTPRLTGFHSFFHSLPQFSLTVTLDNILSVVFYCYFLLGCLNWGSYPRSAWPKGNKSDDEITKRGILLRENKRGDALGWVMLEVWALAGSLKCWRSWGGRGGGGGESITQHCWSWCWQTPSPQYYCGSHESSRARSVTLVAQKAGSPQWREKGTRVEGGHVQVSCPHVSIKCHSSKLG